MRHIGIGKQMRNHFCATGYCQLREDPPEMSRHGPNANLKAGGDRLIGAAVGNHSSDLLFTRTERYQTSGLKFDKDAAYSSHSVVEQYAINIVRAAYSQSDCIGDFVDDAHQS